eukprot:576398-Amphidinium_carterae.1
MTSCYYLRDLSGSCPKAWIYPHAQGPKLKSETHALCCALSYEEETGPRTGRTAREEQEVKARSERKRRSQRRTGQGLPSPQLQTANTPQHRTKWEALLHIAMTLSFTKRVARFKERLTMTCGNR